MDLQDFARTILFESDISTKLAATPGLVNADGVAFHDRRLDAPPSVPDAPGRPAGLELKVRGAAERVAFPTEKALVDPTSRGIVLHFFANHELLAMELMALALLRFPDAPASFRQGLARTIIEEQGHLRLYMERMAELGVGFGSTQVNRFFWDCIAPMRTPLDYVTQMSLTLEQANLDFSGHYRDVFATVGDEKTSTLLDLVYREEIGHVKHGVVWFNRWRPGAQDDWDEYQELLEGTLSPIRAKGIGYDHDARRQAGLSERFIQELAVYKHSKGRPPIVYWFNPGCEAEIAHGSGTFNPPKALQQIENDLATTMQFLTKADDVVWVRNKPSSTFLADLQACGLPIPQFITNESELRGRRIAMLECWGQSPEAKRRHEAWAVECLQPKAFVQDWRVFSKAFSAELFAEIDPSPIGGRVVTSMAEADAEITRRFAEAASPLVIKASFGSSGRNMLRIMPPGLEPKQRQWLQNTLMAQREVVIEPWLDRVLDLSVQVNVANGKRPLLGVTRFLTDARGQYIGHKLGRKFHDQTPETRRALYDGGMLARLQTVAEHIIAKLGAAGYCGPAGIDALVYRDGDQLALKSIVEINPRYTMGRIALELDRYVHHAAEADWLHLNMKQVQALGFVDFPSLIDAGKKAFPPERASGTRGPLIKGFIATNDPKSAALIQTVLVVGPARAIFTAT